MSLNFSSITYIIYSSIHNNFTIISEGCDDFCLLLLLLLLLSRAIQVIFILNYVYVTCHQRSIRIISRRLISRVQLLSINKVLPLLID